MVDELSSRSQKIPTPFHKRDTKEETGNRQVHAKDNLKLIYSAF